MRTMPYNPRTPACRTARLAFREPLGDAQGEGAAREGVAAVGVVDGFEALAYAAEDHPCARPRCRRREPKPARSFSRAPDDPASPS
jgi:hypothetical protein